MLFTHHWCQECLKLWRFPEMKKVIIEWQNQFGGWNRFTEVCHEPSAYRTAKQRAKTTGKRHRLVDADGRVLDIVEP